MRNDGYVAPINHGVLSATGSVAAGIVGGGVKKGLLWGAVWIGAAAIGGAAILSAVAGFAIAPVLVGGLVGGLMGTATSPFAGVLGSAVGAITGGSRAYGEVKQEKGAANMVQAQIDVMKAQQAGNAVNASAYGSKYDFPQQGSAMNAAGTSIHSVQADGRLAGQQLQRA